MKKHEIHFFISKILLDFLWISVIAILFFTNLLFVINVMFLTIPVLNTCITGWWCLEINVGILVLF